MEGKSLDSRDGCLNQDKQERRRKLWTGKIRRGIHSPIPPLYVLLEIKKTGKCVKCPPHPSPPPRKARNAGAD